MPLFQCFIQTYIMSENGQNNGKFDHTIQWNHESNSYFRQNKQFGAIECNEAMSYKHIYNYKSERK